MKHVKRMLLAILIVFILPTLVSAGLWAAREHPASWRDADWSSSGLLKAAADDDEAAIYVFSARTGGFKGSVASHAWIVTKQRGGDYMRYDKVGWGSPIRRNHRPADAFWYSNAPLLVTSVRGAQAERLIPAVEQAIADYPHASVGDYRIYPGPNSNTFVAHVLRSVPELGAVLPPDAVGRDYLGSDRILSVDADGRDLHLSYQGLVGLSAGARSGLELHLLGLVAGVDFNRPAIKLPGLGTIGF